MNWVSTLLNFVSTFRPDTDGNAVLCDCGKPSITLTVRKDGTNQGRQFNKCGDNSTCNFFLWADEGLGNTNNNNNGNSDRSTRDARHDGPAARSSNNVNCNCDMEAVSRTVNKEGANKGRPFYSCKKPMQQSCGFFQWADEDSNQQAPRPSSGPAARRGGGGRGAPTTAGKKRRRCGACGEEGHTKKTCRLNRW